MDDASNLAPDEAVGFALIDADGKPFPSTVAGTERGAKVNSLVSVFQVPVFATDTDPIIDRKIGDALRGINMKISAVYIGPLMATE